MSPASSRISRVCGVTLIDGSALAASKADWQQAYTDAEIDEIVKDPAKKNRIADRALREAKAIAGQDNEPEEWGDSPFTDVRY